VVNFPKPLAPGDLIAVTAPSAGVTGPALARLDLILEQLRARGYRVVEGQCLRSEHKDASAPLEQRAREFDYFLRDRNVSAIFPPWGGELATELLDLLDFKALREVAPKWLLGYSDVSTLQVPLTLVSGWATAHGPNLMDLVPAQTDELTTGCLPLLERDLTAPVEQFSSFLYQTDFIPFTVRFDTPFNPTKRTLWKRLDGSTDPASFSGHLIGGCLDTVAWLAGTRFGDVPAFVRECGDEGVVLFLENVEMSPTGLVRALLSLKRHGWFDGLAGLMIGRSAGPQPESENGLQYAEALVTVLSDTGAPVLYDVDIGHHPPQVTLINGAFAQVNFAGGKGSVVQARAKL